MAKATVCIALDDDHVGSQLGETLRQRNDGPGGELGQGLVGVGQAEVVGGHNLEGIQGLGEHLPVLRGGQHERFEPVRLLLQCPNDRSQLDRLGAGPEDDTGPEPSMGGRTRGGRGRHSHP
jgi:hypothetical protein